MALSQICQPCVQYKSLSPLNKPGTDRLGLICGGGWTWETQNEEWEAAKYINSNFKLYFGVFLIILREA